MPHSGEIAAQNNTPPRRAFLDLMLGAGFVSTLLAMVYPIWRFLIPPASGEPVTSSVVAGRAADFRVDSGVIIKFGARPALVVRTKDGELRAFSATCTHLECTVQYKSDTSQIWCACHNGFYDLAGNVISGPPPRPLERLTTRVRGESGAEEVIVSRG